MKLTIYHLKTCDTCRKAIKALRDAGHDLNVIDVRADGVPRKVLERFLDFIGRDKLLNTRSATWRGLDEAEKADLTDEKLLGLFAQHPTLIKRPVIDTGTNISVGWSKTEQALYL